MSNANSEVKVLQTALKRAEKGRWGKGDWLQKGKNIVTGAQTYLLCLEGLITNGSNHPKTEAQRAALKRMRGVTRDWHARAEIPGTNDHYGFSYEQALDIIRETLRRAKGEKADTAQRTGPNMEELMAVMAEKPTNVVNACTDLVDEKCKVSV